MQYIDVTMTEQNKLCNYVVCEDAVNAIAYFVTSKTQTAANVLRLFIRVDTLSTYLSSFNLLNAFCKRTTDMAIINNAKSLYADDVAGAEQWSLANIFVSGFGILIQLTVTGGSIYDKDDKLMDVTGFVVWGRLTLARLVGESDLDFMNRVSNSLNSIDKLQILYTGDGQRAQNLNVTINKAYIVPAGLFPNAGYNAPYPSGGSLYSSKRGIGDVAGASCVLFWNGKLYDEENIPSITFDVNVKPEYKYRIGTFNSYAEIANPPFRGVQTIIIRPVWEISSFDIIVEINKDIYNITNGYELALIDSQATLLAAQQKSNATITNVLSILGQTAGGVASIAAGNYLSGAILLGNATNGIYQTAQKARNSVKGGNLTSNNAATKNFNMATQIVINSILFVLEGHKQSNATIQALLNAKGYNCLEPISAFNTGRYYEIAADGVEGVPLEYQNNYLERLRNGVYIV